MFIYFVKPGDNLYDLSKRFEVTTGRIISDNGLKNPNNLSVGDTLIIRKEPFVYTSKPGDTFKSIADKYHLSINQLIEDNPNVSEPIKPGTKINVLLMEKNKKSIKVNGYTYPSISDDLLEKTLPYLTYISIFSYRVYEDGSLDDLNEERIIEKARNYDVAPILVISNVKEQGGFSPELASKILNNRNIINTMLNNILSLLKQKNYYGLNIDFEYIKESDKEAYEDFMEIAYDFFKRNGYFYSTALAPKYSSNQKGLLYTAHDYETAEKNNDLVMIMTYEWGYTYSESMPVSPLNKVEDVIKYAVSEIESSKILMGIPNYGYNYTLPYEKGKAAKSLTLDEARTLAYNNNAEIKYYPKSETPYFKYKKDGILHEVQFDNAYSFYKKLELVDEYNLGGISIWTLKTYNPTYFTILDYYFDIEKVI